MYAQIAIDCQTKTATRSCDYCIASKTCHLHADLEVDMQANAKTETMAADLALVAFSGGLTQRSGNA